MIAVPAGIRVLVATKPVDFRRGADSLVALVRVETIEQGLAIVSHNHERFFEAELYRLKARTLLLRGAPDAEAESLLDLALLTARGQQAQTPELRAATDLARLWMNQGKHAAALDVLSSVHGRFTEGFGTRDLKEAEALLTELQRRLLRPAS